MNPILSMLNQPNSRNLLSQLSQVSELINGKDPQKLYATLIQNNPQFRSFVEANKGKSVEQIASENNIDINMIKSML